MGYPDGVKGWRLRDCATGGFFNSRDVIKGHTGRLFLANACPTRSFYHVEKGKALADDLRRLRDRVRPIVVSETSEGVDDNFGEGVIGMREEDAQNETRVFPEHQVNLIITEQSHLSIRSDKRRDPSQLGYDMSIPPATYEEAMKRSDHAGWMEAMKKELGTMKDMGVWKLVEPPPGRKLVGNRWVFEFKPVDLKGGSRFKARLVAQGFSQVPGVDFHQTYAPVARQASVKLLIAVASQNDWELDCFDAKRAFLHMGM